MALSAHLLQQADTYGSASNSLQKPFASKKTLLKVQQDQNVQVKCWEGRGSKDTSLFLTLTVLKGVSAFAQRVGWVSGPLIREGAGVAGLVQGTG